MKVPLRLRPVLIASVAVVLTSSAAGETFRIDSARSNIAFSVHHFVGSAKGKFTQFSGTIELDRQNPERSAVDARIQVRSIDTGIRKRDDHLRNADFFDVANYPQITFTSRSVKRTGPQTGDVTGDLTMHGVTRRVTLRARLLTALPGDALPERTTWEITTGPLKRRDFGLMFAKSAEAISGIGQNVSISMRIEAVKK